MTGIRAGVTLGAWAVLTLSLWAADARPAVVAVGALVTAFAALLFTVIDLSASLSRVTWVQPTRRRAPRRDRRSQALANQVRGAQWFGSTALRDRLIAVVDERLLAHHGIDRRRDPAAAAAVLSPALRSLVGGSGPSITSMREASRVVGDIEAL